MQKEILSFSKIHIGAEEVITGKYDELLMKGGKVLKDTMSGLWNVTLGYSKNYKDLGKFDSNNGILRTGDIGRKKKDGYYYLMGRKDRSVKIFGNRVNLEDILLINPVKILPGPISIIFLSFKVANNFILSVHLTLLDICLDRLLNITFLSLVAPAE